MSNSSGRLKPAHFFKAHAIFTHDEFVASEPDRPPGTVKALLRYHVKRGNLVRVRRGLYMRGDWFEPWLIASRLAPDAVLAYDGALALQRPWLPEVPPGEVERISFLTTARRAGLDSGSGLRFNPVHPARALGKRWRNDVIEIERSGLPVKLTSPGRTLVDLLDRLDLAPVPVELWEAFSSLELDLERMVHHALALKSRLVAARLGFFLEHLPRTPRRHLDPLERRRPSSPAYFDRARHEGTSTFISRWNLVVPLRLWRAVELTDFRSGPPRFPRQSELP